MLNLFPYGSEKSSHMPLSTCLQKNRYGMGIVADCEEGEQFVR